MIRILFFLVAALLASRAVAQDIPGIENCSAEKSWERRTGCLQANVNYLQTAIAKSASDSQQKLAAANTEIASLKATVARLQTSVDQLAAATRAAQEAAKKPADAKAK